jgi:hypothetical protein
MKGEQYSDMANQRCKIGKLANIVAATASWALYRLKTHIISQPHTQQ